MAGIPNFGELSERDIRQYTDKMHKTWCKACNSSAIAEPAKSLDLVTPDGISEAHGDGWFITADVEGKKNKMMKQSYMMFVDNRICCSLIIVYAVR